MKKLLVLCLSISSFFAQAQTPLVHFAFNNSTGDQSASESVSGAVVPVINHFNRPEYISGLDGMALRLDGWSTFVNQPSFSISGINRQMTIETWYATESFTKESSAIFDWAGANAGTYLCVGPSGEINFGYFIDGNFVVHNTPNHLTRYQWHHIVAEVNLDGGFAKIYVDNVLWFSKTGLTGTQLTTGSQSLLIGKRNLNQTSTGFSLNTLNGAVDDIRIYSTALDSTTIGDHFNAVGERTVELKIDPQVRYAGDYLRPQYHPMPNAVWANECYGLIYYNNKYHLFFQKNPNGPYLYYMHWGHLSSPDLVNWTEERIALAPNVTPGFDSFGVWSGTTTLGNDGIPRILYTGVDTQKAGIGLASPDDNELIGWTKSASNPVIGGAPSGTMDFRDTYVWKDQGNYYMAVGSGVNGNGGVVYCYRSVNLQNWTLLGPLYRDASIARSGTFWEMPFFFKISAETYVLGVNPVPTSTTKAVTLYWLGTWQNEKFTPYDQTPKKLEFIAENMLAPAFGNDKDGNPVLIGIIPEDRSQSDQIAAGWRQTFSVAREPRLLKDSTVAEIPYRNLCSLRGTNIGFQNRTVTTGTNFNLPELGGSQIELQFKIKADSASVFTVQVFKNPDSREFTALKFDLAANTITLDKRFSTFSKAVTNSRTENYIFSPGDTINIRMFLDHSTLEVFVDNLVVISSRVYPSRIEDDKVDLIVNSGTIEILDAHQWQMYGIGLSSSNEVCIPNNLPTQLYKQKKNDVVTGVIEESEAVFHLFPNPSPGIIHLQKTGEWSVEFCVYNVIGEQVLVKDISNLNNGVDLGSLSSGVYLGRSINGSRIQHFKILIQH